MTHSNNLLYACRIDENQGFLSELQIRNTIQYMNVWILDTENNYLFVNEIKNK